MNFEEFTEKIIDGAEPITGLKFDLAVLWLHPERLPVKVIALDSNDYSIIKIPAWYTNQRNITVSVITFTKQLFAGRAEVADIILSSNICKIPEGAFAGCKELKRITIPKKVSVIHQGTFNDCNSLENVYYEGTKDEWERINIVHEGYREVNSSELGLYCNLKKYPIPGNEPLFKAKIHFNCQINKELKDGKNHDKQIELYGLHFIRKDL